MRTNLIHYTLNTADSFDCSQKEFKLDAIRSIQPIARWAMAEGSIQMVLTKPLNDFSVNVTVVEGVALFNLYEQEQIISINAVAWTETGAEECWPGFESLYLKLSARFELVSISRSPQRPTKLPWLATLVLPVIAPPWLADFEQCLSIALIQESKPRRPKPLGFGRD